MLHPPVERVSQDEALSAVAGVIDRIDEEGLLGLLSLTPTAPDDVAPQVASALASLSDAPGTAAMIAEALAEKAFGAFCPTLRQFQKDFAQLGDSVPGAERVPCSSGGSDEQDTEHLQQQQQVLLCAFVDRFRTVRAVVRALCRRLGVAPLAEVFAVNVRCALLQPDTLTGAAPRGGPELTRFLWHYARLLLHRGPPAAVGGRENSREPVASADGGGAAAYVAVLRADPVLAAVEELGLNRTPEVRALWRGALVAGLEARVAAVPEDYGEPALRGCLRWAEQVVEPFVCEALVRGGPGSAWPPSCRAALAESCGGVRRDRLSAELRERMLLAFARRRIAAFWDIMAEYPDSAPALGDVRYCLQSCPHGGLMEELTDHLRGLLAARLHRAGTRTEDILVMLSKAVHALWALLPRNEQSAVVLAVVSATLEHLRRRRDCVSAVVQVLTQSGGDTALSPGASGGGGGAVEDDDADGTDALGPRGVLDGGRGSGGGGSSGTRERPDLLRILLMAIPVRALTEEYQHALAERLLAKSLHDFDTTPEEEVLERLKYVLGGDVLPSCEAMVHDIQVSKRTTNQLRARLAEGSFVVPVEATSLDVLSLTVWPKLAHCLPAGEPVPPPDTYTCHPALQGVMERLAEAYKVLKQGQKLCWMLTQGRVTLDVKQRRDESPTSELVTTPHTLSLFAASIVLYMMDLDRAPSGDGSPAGGVPLRALAAKLDVSVTTLLPHLPPLSPALLVLDSGCGTAAAGEGGEEGGWVALQRVLPTASRVLFGEASQDAEEGAKPKTSLDDDQLSLLRTMAVAMLQNSGAATMSDIMNSLKMFTGIDVTSADMKVLMHLLVSDGSVLLTENKTYALA